MSRNLKDRSTNDHPEQKHSPKKSPPDSYCLFSSQLYDPQCDYLESLGTT